MELEDRYVTSTPEGVSLSLVLAGVGSRGAAYLIDIAVQTVVDIAVFWALRATVSTETSSFVATGIFALVYFVVTFGYFVMFEMLDSGRSLGKRALGIKVTRLDGSGETFRASLVRNLLRVLYVFPLFYLVDGALIIGTRRNQRLGDFLAGTLVIRERLGTTTTNATAPLAGAGGWQDPACLVPAPSPGVRLGTRRVPERALPGFVATRARLLGRDRRDPSRSGGGARVSGEAIRVRARRKKSSCPRPGSEALTEGRRAYDADGSGAFLGGGRPRQVGPRMKVRRAVRCGACKGGCEGDAKAAVMDS